MAVLKPEAIFCIIITFTIESEGYLGFTDVFKVKVQVYQVAQNLLRHEVL